VEEVAELAEGSSECGELLRGGCLFAWKFSVTRSAVCIEMERGTGPNVTLSLR
jgi:hypothetical protein